MDTSQGPAALTGADGRDVPPVPDRTREPRRLMMLFGLLYFVQGIAEPTEGLIAQPVRSLLESWGESAASITRFAGLLALPWAIKPLYGLLTDFVPLGGGRRRGYLLWTTAATAAGLLWVYLSPPARGATTSLLLLLLAPTIAVAFSDVVIDGLMIDKGQPLGLTGRFQAVQWAASYGATILVGVIGGQLSHHGRHELGFLICALAALLALVVAWRHVREDERHSATPPVVAARQLWGTLRDTRVLAIAAFLFLWSFNPFSSAVLQVHAIRELGIDQREYGVSVSMLAVGAIAASVAYGWYCPFVPRRWLVHLGVLAGVAATLAYRAVEGPRSLQGVSLLVGFAYMTGSMAQYDLAARVCPAATAGTTFALLMSVSNLAVAMSTIVGGQWYDTWSAALGSQAAFRRLVDVGAAATCLCWLVLPWLVPSPTTREASPGDASQ